MEIRKAKVSNVAEIIELWKQLMDYHRKLDLFFTRSTNGHINFRKHLVECIESEDACVFIAVENEEILGYILGKIQEYPPVFETEKYAEIFDMYVKQDFRRQKIGERLVKNAVDYFKKKGLSRIEMKVATKNKPGIDFWKNQGFEEYMKIMCYRK